MTDHEIYAKLQLLFDDIFLQPVVVTPELSADDVEEWDSLMHVQLILAVEEVLEVRFAVGEVEATRNIGDLVRLIHRKSGR